MEEDNVWHSNCILQNKLYLGTGQQANTDAVIVNLGITHIVNATKEIPCKYTANDLGQNKEEKENAQNPESENPKVPAVQYLHIQIDDMESAAAELRKHFESATGFIDSALSVDTNRVLVHCEMGVSRSTTLVLAYLMKYGKMTLCQAYDHTKKCRDLIRPNEGFFAQLVEYEETLSGKSTLDELKALGLREVGVDQKAANLKMGLVQAIAINQGRVKTKRKKKKEKRAKKKGADQNEEASTSKKVESE